MSGRQRMTTQPPAHVRQPRSNGRHGPLEFRSVKELAATASIRFPEAIRVKAVGLRGVVRTVDEGLGLIDHELPAELRRLPRWTFAHALLLEARRTGSKRDLTKAVRQLRQALNNEGWLPEDGPSE